MQSINDCVVVLLEVYAHVVIHLVIVLIEIFTEGLYICAGFEFVYDIR